MGVSTSGWAIHHIIWAILDKPVRIAQWKDDEEDNAIFDNIYMLNDIHLAAENYTVEPSNIFPHIILQYYTIILTSLHTLISGDHAE